MHDLTHDAIADITAPRGQITGFPRSHIRANWPTFTAGKQLTDRRIAYYQSKGYYGTNGILALSKVKTQKKQKHIPAAKRLEMLIKKYTV